MLEDSIFIMALITSFLQVLHIFEEIHLEAYNIMKGKTSKKRYFFIASILILVNFIVIFLLYFRHFFGYYAAFITVFMSVGNSVAHLSLSVLYELFLSRIYYGLC